MLSSVCDYNECGVEVIRRCGENQGTQTSPFSLSSLPWVVQVQVPQAPHSQQRASPSRRPEKVLTQTRLNWQQMAYLLEETKGRILDLADHAPDGITSDI
jgi:hypothetical protein